MEKHESTPMQHSFLTVWLAVKTTMESRRIKTALLLRKEELVTDGDEAPFGCFTGDKATIRLHKNKHTRL